MGLWQEYRCSDIVVRNENEITKSRVSKNLETIDIVYEKMKCGQT